MLLGVVFTLLHSYLWLTVVLPLLVLNFYYWISIVEHYTADSNLGVVISVDPPLTLDKYTEVFKESPPQDIWPDCQKRFCDADKFVRLNSADYFLLKRRPLISLGPIVTLPLLLAACVKSDVGVGGIALLVFLGVSGFFLLCKLLSHKKKDNDGGGGCGSALGGKGSDGGSGCSGCGGCGG